MLFTMIAVWLKIPVQGKTRKCLIALLVLVKLF